MAGPQLTPRTPPHLLVRTIFYNRNAALEYALFIFNRNTRYIDIRLSGYIRLQRQPF